nr:YSIRK-type signal peptide-containing protein [Lactobacillus johnsonii]
MVSKNSYSKKMRKIRPQKQRFSIRKFTVGGCFCTNWFNLYRC